MSEGITQDQIDEMLNIGEHPEGEGAKTGTTTSSSGGGWMLYFGIGAVVLLALFFFMLRSRPKKI